MSSFWIKVSINVVCLVILFIVYAAHFYLCGKIETLSDFFQHYWVIIYLFIAAYIPWYFEKYFLKKATLESENEKLRKRQKQRIQILDQFNSEQSTRWLLGKRSIYESIIEVLDRAGKEIPEKKRTNNSVVKLLLCSPSLDYDYCNRHLNINGEKSYKDWGIELLNKIKDIEKKRKFINVEITHLPNFPIFGYNPIKDFVSVLANYCNTNKDVVQFEKIYNEICEATAYMFKELNLIVEGRNHDKDALKLEISHKFNIPFQIVLVLDEEIQDVVVSFAGREIIESKKDVIPKGFRSTDRRVVEVFSDIYDKYVDMHTRRPFPPIHTLEIEKELKKRSGTITIKDYLKNILPKPINIIVYKDVFCPNLCNSSKFTSLVLTKNTFELKGKQVLDVGSGTGVQAMVAAVCEAKKVVATEKNDVAYKNLEENTNTLKKEYGYDIECWKGDLFDTLPIEYKTKFFDIIIGDMPFVNAKSDPNIPIHQCLYDNNHEVHKLLLTKSKDYINESGKLYTSFSTLGGPEDVEFFEKIIHETGWCVSCKHTFFEDGYGWFVYELSQKEEDWRKFLCVKDIEVQIQSKSTIST